MAWEWPRDMPKCERWAGGEGAGGTFAMVRRSRGNLSVVKQKGRVVIDTVTQVVGRGRRNLRTGMSHPGARIYELGRV